MFKIREKKNMSKLHVCVFVKDKVKLLDKKHNNIFRRKTVDCVHYYRVHQATSAEDKKTY